MMNQVICIHSGTSKFVEVVILVFAQCNTHQGFRDPIRVSWTAGDVHYLLTAARDKIFT